MKILCPCCKFEKHLLLNNLLIAELAEQWKKHFKMDAFDRWSEGDVIKQLRCMQCALVFHTPEIFGDDAFYAQLSVHDWYYEKDKWEFDIALDLVNEQRPMSLLEVGCGSGEFLQKVQYGVEVTMGIDINPHALQRARNKGLNVYDQPINSITQKFDMIVLFEVLEHLQYPGEMLTEIVDRLNPGGILVIAVPNPGGYLKNQGVVLLDLPPHHSTKWSRETFSYIEKRFGLHQVIYATEPLRYIHYQAYMTSIIKSGVKSRTVYAIQRLAFKVLSPFLYDIGKHNILGQTHLVALKKSIS